MPVTPPVVPPHPVPHPGATKRSLSPARRRLLALLQDLNFGRVEGLVVRGGESASLVDTVAHRQ